MGTNNKKNDPVVPPVEGTNNSNPAVPPVEGTDNSNPAVPPVEGTNNSNPGVPPVEGTEVSIEEKIKQQAEKYFDSYPNSKAIFATKDGNFWLDTNESAAKNYAEANKMKLYKFEKHQLNVI